MSRFAIEESPEEVWRVGAAGSGGGGARGAAPLPAGAGPRLALGRDDAVVAGGVAGEDSVPADAHLGGVVVRVAELGQAVELGQDVRERLHGAERPRVRIEQVRELA